ncbi:HypC/HybG/HupF family hydrogenase formation chaperone [Bacteroidota bacterium]
MKPEIFFLKYSFPCAHVLLEMGSIDEKKLEELKQNTINEVVMSHGELMMLFPSAFRRIIEVAEKMKKDVWDIEVLRKYFLEEHNMYIDNKDGNYENFGTSFRDFCKVYKAKIVHKEDNVLTVEYGERSRNVFNDILPEAKVGDTVTIHQAFAVEVIE